MQAVERRARCGPHLASYIPAMRPVPASDLAAAVRACFAAAPPVGVAAAWLFGSHAEGRAHQESDVDVGVLLGHARFPGAVDRFEAGLRLAGWLIAELRHPLVDLVVLDDAPPGLAARVVTRGVLVRLSDAELEHAFRRDVQLRVADLEPFLRRTRALKLAALDRPAPPGP